MATGLIPLRMVGFANSVVDEFDLRASRAEVLHAAVTSGHGVSAVGGKYPFSFAELSWKLPMANALLTIESDHWVRRRSTDQLDPSEKSAGSYFLGNVQTALVARRVFHMTHVIHLSKVDPKAYTRVEDGRRLPDFVAVDLVDRRALVIESKGSFGSVHAGRLEHALQQLSTRVTLRGYKSHIRYAHLSEFHSRRWSGRLVRQSGRSSAIEVSPGGLLFLFYLPIRDAIRRHLTSTDYDITRAQVGGISIGLDSQILNAMDDVVARAELERLSTAQVLRRGDDPALVQLNALASLRAATTVDVSGDGRFEGRDGVEVTATDYGDESG